MPSASRSDWDLKRELSVFCFLSRVFVQICSAPSFCMMGFARGQSSLTCRLRAPSWQGAASFLWEIVGLRRCFQKRLLSGDPRLGIKPKSAKKD